MMVDTIKRGTIRYYVARRTEIIDILAHGGHTPDYVKRLEGARDMATERIQQLTDIAVSRAAIVPADRDRSLQRILDDVLGRKQTRIGENHAKHELFNDDGANTRSD
jgi:hypothetical protein